jgi:hypothetical protein
MRFTTAIAIVAALPIATVLIASQRSKPVSSATSPPPVIETPAPVAPTPPPKAANAAEIGDRVVLRYPASTIMCSLENDATGIALAGKIALGQTMRVENDAYSAVKAMNAARKETMRTLYSCSWAPAKDVQFRVEQKRLTGTPKDLFYTVSYCLSIENKCWWIIEDQTSESPFKSVERS